MSMVSDASVLLPKPAREPSRVRLPLVQKYLDEQKRLTAVERFSQRHEADALAPGARYYRDLLPLERPGPGQQLSFQVDLDACSGCKACVTACHHLNGLDDDEGETWRSVGLLHGGSAAEPVQQTVTTACHHCLEPACMKGCPVGAYEKDPVTGIVKHLDDQCIGCQYCTLTCPYEVPQYSKKRGIVRKCDMCSDRLAVGEPPACVQACPNEAIAIRVVDTAQVLEDAQGEAFLPGAPPPTVTVPTTTYKTRRAIPRNLLPADFHRVRTSHQHFPLVVLLVLTQLSVGTFVVDLAMGTLGSGSLAIGGPQRSLLALAMGLLALGASTFHLGRPAYAFRAVLGIRTSWMSREVLAFGLFAGTAVLHAALYWVEPVAAVLGVPLPAAETLARAHTALGFLVAASGVLGVACSVMLYQVTARRWWSLARTSLRFVLTSAVLGLATTTAGILFAGALDGRSGDAVLAAQSLAVPLLVAASLKLLADAEIFVHLRTRGLGELKRTALLLAGELKKFSAARFGLGLCALLLVAAFARNGAPEPLAALALGTFSWALFVLAEGVERMLFFRALSAPKMPGAVGP
jgi:Fe-S-cluster-containing dehydrogenase component/DMSO reductase anchor subunit